MQEAVDDALAAAAEWLFPPSATKQLRRAERAAETQLRRLQRSEAAAASRERALLAELRARASRGESADELMGWARRAEAERGARARMQGALTSLARTRAHLAAQGAQAATGEALKVSVDAMSRACGAPGASAAAAARLARAVHNADAASDAMEEALADGEEEGGGEEERASALLEKLLLVDLMAMPDAPGGVGQGAQRVHPSEVPPGRAPDPGDEGPPEAAR